MLASYLRVGGCREEKCVSPVPRCGWVSEGVCYPRTYVLVDVGRSVLASYLRVGGCWEEKCVSLVPTCGWVLGGEKCYSLVPTCGWVSVGEMC